MDIIDSLLDQVAHGIDNNDYIWTDIVKIAMTDNCHSPEGWQELLVTANAFLNTKGGTIFIGIIDDEINNRFIFTGYDHTLTTQLSLLASAFADSNDLPLDLAAHFKFSITPFRGGDVLVIAITAACDPEAEQYAYYQGTAWQRIKTGNQRIQGHSLRAKTEESGSTLSVPKELIAEEKAEPLPEITAEEETPTEEAALQVQKIYSGELITLFGADYISLEPDFKQLLSFIYERNNEEEPKHPTIAEICSRLWTLRGEVDTPKGFELLELKVKKIISQMEKSGFINRANSRGGYKISTDYQGIKNLFN